VPKIIKSLTDAFPEIAVEWNYEKNGDIKPTEISSSTNNSYWWQCKNNSSHEWKTRVNHRTKIGTGCPFCSGRYADDINNLKVKRPDISTEWNYKKNELLLPENVTPSAGKKVWWQCKVNPSHEWEAIVSSRTGPKAAGCPYCYGRFASAKNSVAATFPELVEEWHPTKNGVFTPENVTVSSGKKYWWQCKKGHEWQEFPFNRKKGITCPYCSKYRPSQEYNLAIINPLLSEEWDCFKNKEKPENVLPNSGKKFWWKCKRGHGWRAAPVHRIKGTGCPICSAGAQSSRPEIRVLTELKAIFDDVEHRSLINGKEIDVYIKDYKVGIEIDGLIWHKEKYLSDLEKTRFFESMGIKLIRFREKGLAAINPSTEILFEKNITKKGIDSLLLIIESVIDLKFNDEVKIESYLRERFFVSDSLYMDKIADSSFLSEEDTLKFLHPEIACEWHPTKNSLLTPKNVYAKSGLSVWWFCRICGKVWKTSISHRTHSRTGCPECAKKKIGDAQRTLSIEIFKKIAEKKGGKCLSEEYVTQLTKLEFECAKGHRWAALPVNLRNKGSWCPVCQKDKSSKGRMQSIDIFHKIAAEKGGTCLTLNRASGKEKISFECNKGHRWSVVPSSVKMGTWCPTCAGTQKLSLEDYKKIAEIKGGRCLSTEYINGKGKLRFECSEGHLWESQASSVKAGNWCKRCGSKRGREKQLAVQKDL
jgi:hypothetical protein